VIFENGKEQQLSGEVNKGLLATVAIYSARSRIDKIEEEKFTVCAYPGKHE